MIESNDNKGKANNKPVINCDEILKNRLYSFGISKGIEVTLVEFTLTKSTIEIKVNQSKIALRLNEASKIEVSRG
mgnify:CR=1 FL=1